MLPDIYVLILKYVLVDCRFGVIDGKLTSDVPESSKIRTIKTILEVEDGTLHIYNTSGQLLDYRTLDCSKFKVELNGTDTDDYLRIKVLPRTRDVVSELQKRMSGVPVSQTSDNKAPQLIEDVPLQNYKKNSKKDLLASMSIYNKSPTAHGDHSIYYKETYFYLVVTTPRGTRYHELGDLTHEADYISRFAKILETMSQPANSRQILELLKENHMSDSAKMKACLKILLDKGIIIKNGIFYLYSKHAKNDNELPLNTLVR